MLDRRKIKKERKKQTLFSKYVPIPLIILSLSWYIVVVLKCLQIYVIHFVQVCFCFCHKQPSVNMYIGKINNLDLG